MENLQDLKLSHFCMLLPVHYLMPYHTPRNVMDPRKLAKLPIPLRFLWNCIPIIMRIGYRQTSNWHMLNSSMTFRMWEAVKFWIICHFWFICDFWWGDVKIGNLGWWSRKFFVNILWLLKRNAETNNRPLLILKSTKKSLRNLILSR